MRKHLPRGTSMLVTSGSRISYASWLLGVLLIAHLDMSAQRLTVTLQDAKGSPIPGATVYLRPPGAGADFICRGMERTGGQYAVFLPDDAATSEYDVEVAAPGYSTLKTRYSRSDGYSVLYQMGKHGDGPSISVIPDANPVEPDANPVVPDVPWDTIVKTDNTSIQCKILNVTDANIEYKPKKTKTNIPFLIVSRSEVISIIYADGTVVPIAAQEREKKVVEDVTIKNLPQEREVICKSCNGSGVERVACSVCNGSGRLKCGMCDNGKVLKWVIVIGGRAHFETFVCSNCNGSTQVACYGCNGAGMVFITCRACGGTKKMLLNK